MRKKLVIAGALLVIMAALVVGTLAYFTDTTQTAKNSFSVGNVDITLDEGTYDPATGETDTDTRTEEGNDYGVLMPGQTVTKDPTVHVSESSQDSYLFVKLGLTKYMSLLMMYGQLNDVPLAELNLTDTATRVAVTDTYIGGLDHSKWTVMNPEVIQAASSSDRPVLIEVVLGYKDPIKAGDEITVFNELKMPDGITSDMLEEVPNFTRDDFDIEITAYAIQQAELDDLDAAYAAMKDTILPSGE